MESLPLTVFIKHGVIALFGAITQALIEHRELRSRTFFDFVVLIIVGSFTGVMFGLLALNFFPNNQYISMSITGAGAVMGKEGLSMLSKKLLDMLRITIEKKPKNDL